VTAKELDQAKTYALGVHAIRQQSGAAVIGEMIDAYLFGRLAELEEFESRIKAVSAEEMRAIARRYFVEDRRVEGIVRGRTTAPSR
jgi:zinc protease